MTSASTPLLGIVQLGAKHLAATTSRIHHQKSVPTSIRTSSSLSSQGMKLAREVDGWTQSDWSRTFHDLDRQQAASSRFTKLTKRVGQDIHNIESNRYPNVLPYDHTLVNITDERTGEDIYINANHVTVTGANRHYILTQGPLERTVDQFWLMVFQQASNVIVMLCKCEEPNGYNRLVQKSGRYWPDRVGDTLVLGEMTGGLEVTLTESTCSKESGTESSRLGGTRYDFIKRTMILTSTETGEKRTVKHFHYVTWPDFDVPSSPDLLIDFILDIRSSDCFSTVDTPPIIHCSAGIGRSGTLALVDSCLVLAETPVPELSLSTVLETLRTMRTMRAGCIQTEDQLRFSVVAILAGLDRLGLNKSHKRVNTELETGDQETKKRKNSQS